MGAEAGTPVHLGHSSPPAGFPTQTFPEPLGPGGGGGVGPTGLAQTPSPSPPAHLAVLPFLTYPLPPPAPRISCLHSGDPIRVDHAAERCPPTPGLVGPAWKEQGAVGVPGRSRVRRDRSCGQRWATARAEGAWPQPVSL